MLFFRRYSRNARAAIMRSSGSSSAIRISTRSSASLISNLPDRLGCQQGYQERRALPRGAASGDAPSVAFGDASANGKPHAGALVLAAAVQPLEWGEDAREVFLVKADAVVGDL